MRELILLRHAHAEPPAAGQSDLDRPLSAEGNAEAEAAGRWLREQRLVPDLALCSPSRRTRETLEAVLGQVGYVDQRLEDDIYEASPRSEEHTSELQSLMRISYAVFCLKKKKTNSTNKQKNQE